MKARDVLNRCRALTAMQRWAVLAAIFGLPLSALSIRLLGAPRVLRWASRCAATARRSSVVDEVPAARQLASAVNAVAYRRPWRANCLTRSLFLLWLLARHGIAAELVIGARLIDGVLEAHAWVTCAHQPVNDTADVASRFAPFDGLTASAVLVDR